MSDLEHAVARAVGGGPERHREKAREQGKLPVRERLGRLLDEGSFAEDALLANWEQDGLGADGVVTGVGTVAGRPVAVMANDPTVKAGSWGPKTVEKILRVQERALSSRIPMVYLVDSAGARITEQVQMFPGRRGAGRIFFNEVRMSGVVPQVCVLFGPSAAGGAYIPAFCDVVIMRDGNASMYLGSPRMAEMVIGEQVTLEEMGGARMHTGVSGCGHFLVRSDEEGVDVAQRYLSYFPAALGGGAARRRAGAAARRRGADPRRRPRRREQAVRHAPPPRRARRRGLVPGGPRALGQGAPGRLRAPRRPRGRHRGQPAAPEGRRPLRRLGRQGGAVHPDLQRVRRAAAVPGRRPGLHDRHPGRAPGHHPPRREDGQRRERGDGPEALRRRAQGLRRRPLRDGRARLRARRLPGAAGRVDRGHGPAGGRQRRLLQPAAGDRRTPTSARAARRSCARSTPRTSTSCTSRASSSSTPWSSPRTCATSSCAASPSRPGRPASGRASAPPSRPPEAAALRRSPRRAGLHDPPQRRRRGRRARRARRGRRRPRRRARAPARARCPRACRRCRARPRACGPRPARRRAAPRPGRRRGARPRPPRRPRRAPAPDRGPGPRSRGSRPAARRRSPSAGA